MVSKISSVMVMLALASAGCAVDGTTGAGDEAKADDANVASTAEALSFTSELGDAIIEGTGCSYDSTAVTHEDGVFTFDFWDLGVGLFPVNGSATAGRSTCVIRIPITVPAGYYVSRVGQTADYQVETTTGGKAAIASTASIIGASVGGLSAKWNGDASESSSLYRSTSFQSQTSCSTAPQSGFLSVNLVVTASRTSRYDTALAYLNRFTLDASKDIVLSRCSN